MDTDEVDRQAVLAMREVRLIRSGRDILSDVTWQVRAGERWVVLGPNGAGKTTLLQLASTYEIPSKGTVHVLGHRVGRVYLPQLRAHIGYSATPLQRLLDPDLTVADAIATGRHAVLRRWRETYDDADRARAAELAERVGLAPLLERPVGRLSDGERQRLHLARSLMPRPELLLLDEPAAGLDIAGRELLVGALAGLAAEPSVRAAVLVTHHAEEIPPGFTHAALLCDGRILRAGPLRQTLTGEAMSEAFGLPLRVHERDGRWFAAAG